jgi:hypothetical protein
MAALALVAKQKLNEALGENATIYWKLFRDFLAGKVSTLYP